MNLYSDFRIGGSPRFILSAEPPNLMFIPDEVRKCVVYVGYRLPTGETSLQGTAFFVTRQIEGTDKAFAYVVTARHVIEGIEGVENFDGKIVLKMNFKDGSAYPIETDVKAWRFHPDQSEAEVDVAVFPFAAPLLKGDVKTIPIEMFLNEKIKVDEEIGIGDDLFLTGLFYNHSGRKRNIPIVRVGNIAAMPEERVKTGKMGYIDAYLMETRSIGGLSGSPVFVCLGADRKMKEGAILMATGKRGGVFYFLGLMHGHYKVESPSEEVADTDARAKDEAVNMGIAIVVPSEKVLEVISQPAIRDIEKKEEERILAALLPVPDSNTEGD